MKKFKFYLGLVLTLCVFGTFACKNNVSSTSNSDASSTPNKENVSSTSIVVKYDRTKMKVTNKMSTSNWESVESGASLAVGDTLICKAILPFDGYIVDKWFVNDVEKEKYRTFVYKLDLADAKDVDGVKTVEIRVETKLAKKIKITFDLNKVSCIKSLDSFESGTQAQEEYFLEFTANLDTGKIVDYWFLNGVKQDYQNDRRFSYVVKLDDAKESNGEQVIEVSFTEKDAQKAIVKFDSNITCVNRVTNVNVLSGTTIYEKDELDFTANLASDENNVKWYINGKEQDFYTRKFFWYTVDMSDAKDESGTKILEISFIK